MSPPIFSPADAPPTAPAATQSEAPAISLPVLTVLPSTVVLAAVASGEKTPGIMDIGDMPSGVGGDVLGTGRLACPWLSVTVVPWLLA